MLQPVRFERTPMAKRSEPDSISVLPHHRKILLESVAATYSIILPTRNDGSEEGLAHGDPAHIDRRRVHHARSGRQVEDSAGRPGDPDVPADSAAVLGSGRADPGARHRLGVQRFT